MLTSEECSVQFLFSIFEGSEMTTIAFDFCLSLQLPKKNICCDVVRVSYFFIISHIVCEYQMSDLIWLKRFTSNKVNNLLRFSDFVSYRAPISDMVATNAKFRIPRNCISR